MSNKEIVNVAKTFLREKGHDISTGCIYEMFAEIYGDRSWDFRKKTIWEKIRDLFRKKEESKAIEVKPLTLVEKILNIDSLDSVNILKDFHIELKHNIIEEKNGEIDPFGVEFIVAWDKELSQNKEEKSIVKVAVVGRFNQQKLSEKQIIKLRKGMAEYNCPRGIIYTSKDGLPQSLYKIAYENNIEIVDYEDLIRLSKSMELVHNK